MTFYIDGNNVAQWDSDTFCIATLLTLCRELEKKGHDFICYFDANIDYKPQTELEKNIITEILKDKKRFWKTTPRTRADDFIVVAANRDSASVISNDRYRKVPTYYSWLSEDHLPKRLFKGGVSPAAKGRRLLSIPELGIDSYIETDLERLISELNIRQSNIKTKPSLTKERRLFFKYELIKEIILMLSCSDHSGSFEIIKKGTLDRNLFKSIIVYFLNGNLHRVAEFKISSDLASESILHDDNIWELHYNLITPIGVQSPEFFSDVYSYISDIKKGCFVKYSDIWYSWRDEIMYNPTKLIEAKKFCGLLQGVPSLPPWDIDILDEDIEYSQYLIEFVDNRSDELIVVIN